MRTDHVLIKADNFTCYGQNGPGARSTIRSGEQSSAQCGRRDAREGILRRSPRYPVAPTLSELRSGRGSQCRSYSCRRSPSQPPGEFAAAAPVPSNRPMCPWRDVLPARVTETTNNGVLHVVRVVYIRIYCMSEIRLGREKS